MLACSLSSRGGGPVPCWTPTGEHKGPKQSDSCSQGLSQAMNWDSICFLLSPHS